MFTRNLRLVSRRWRSLVMVALGFLCPALVQAHDPGLSVVQGVWTAAQLELTAGFAPADAQLFLPADARVGDVFGEAEFERVRSQLEAFAPRLWTLTAGGASVPPKSSRVVLLPGDNVSFTVIFPRPPGQDPVTLRASQLDLLAPNHRQFVIVTDERGSTVAKKLLSTRDNGMEVGVPATDAAAEPAQPTFGAFLWLGIEHIWMGYDHLLFLFALLIVCRDFRSTAIIISCFTLAHTLTLGLATADLVSLPARITEPAIAASIIFVGVENLLRRGAEPKGRWALTFVFGLVHGFGFASVLRDLGVGESADGIMVPLFAFNLGVEVGQIAIAAVVLPLLWRLRRNEKFVQRGVPALSALAAAAGLYWFIERTLF